jgi:hypothetical protein
MKMNTADTARVNWSWKQVEAAKKAEAAAKAVWVANSTTANWQAWQDAEDRTAAARSMSDRSVKQAVMQNDAMRVW